MEFQINSVATHGISILPALPWRDTEYALLLWGQHAVMTLLSMFADW